MNGSGWLAYIVMWETSKLQSIWLLHPAIRHLYCPRGRHCVAPYLPLRISCCLKFFMKWIFLKLFGRGEPDRVRHLKSLKRERKKLCQWDSKVQNRDIWDCRKCKQCFWSVSHLRRGAFSSMSSSVSREERWEMSLRLWRQMQGKESENTRRNVRRTTSILLSFQPKHMTKRKLLTDWL